MDLEETKKIIQYKIEADEAAREVRSHIKTYIHEKQNLREGFTETFKPLIETSEKVKDSIDTQQNKLIEQLQKNQLALTAGFEGNRKAITSGFDKMDEVKKWDLQQLPGYEATLDAIEEPEKEDKAEDINEKIKIIDARIDENIDTSDEFIDLANKAKEEGKKELSNYYMDKVLELYEKYKDLKKERKRLKEILGEKDEEEDEEKQEPSKRVISFDDADFDSGLNNAIAVKFLKENDLPLPSLIKKESLKTIKAYQKKSEDLLKVYHDLLSNKAKFDIIGGVSKAFARNKNPHFDTLLQISYYNVLGENVNNINKLENIAKKTGQGIIHFNNPNNLSTDLNYLLVLSLLETTE